MDDFFTEFNQGLRSAHGVMGAFHLGQEIAANRRKAERDQEDKDAFAAAELLTKIEGAENRPEELRQLQTQFDGYSPRTKYLALGHKVATRRFNDEDVKLKFQEDYRDAVGEMNKAKVYFQQGRNLEGMQALNSIMNNQLRDGKTYEIIQGEDGGFRQVIMDRHGNEIQSSPVTPDEMYTQFTTILRDPGQAFNAYSTALSEMKKDNYKEYDTFSPEHTYVDPKTGAQFHRKKFLDWRTNSIREHWFQNYREVSPPDLSKLKNLKQLQTEQDRATTEEKAKLDIKSKRLDITGRGLDNKIKEENLEQERILTERAKLSKDDEPEAQRKVYERDVIRSVSTQFMKPNLKVDEDNLIVYSVNSIGEEKVDESATRFLRKKVAETDEYIRKNKKPNESRADAFRRITDETVERDRKLSEERSEKQRTAAPSESRFAGRAAPVPEKKPAPPEPKAATSGVPWYHRPSTEILSDVLSPEEEERKIEEAKKKQNKGVPPWSRQRWSTPWQTGTK